MGAYVSEFVAAIRHPDHEKGQESTFHVVLTDWIADITGTFRPQTVGPLTPEAAARYGFTLPKILDEVTAAAVRDAAASAARAAEAEQERDVAKEEWSQMAAEAKKAKDSEAAAVRAAGQMAEGFNAVMAENAALAARIDKLTAPSDEPENPILNFLSFGKLGN